MRCRKYTKHSAVLNRSENQATDNHTIATATAISSSEQRQTIFQISSKAFDEQVCFGYTFFGQPMR